MNCCTMNADMVQLKGPINIKPLFSQFSECQICWKIFYKRFNKVLKKGFYSRIKRAFNEFCFLNNLCINIF